jgi:hypothetical protein
LQKGSGIEGYNTASLTLSVVKTPFLRITSGDDQFQTHTLIFEKEDEAKNPKWTTGSTFEL